MGAALARRYAHSRDVIGWKRADCNVLFPERVREAARAQDFRTLVEAWSFRAVGAPDVLLQRALTYNRLVFSPMSMVAHDDLHLFESMQRGLASGSNEWVSLHRNHDRAERDAAGPRDVNGTNELLMRNQFRAWVRFMTLNLEPTPRGEIP